MITKRRALTSFKRLKDEELLALAATVYQAMNENPNFPSPKPDTIDLRVTYDDYYERLGSVKQRGGFYEASLKNDSRNQLEKVLKQLAFHVNMVSAGNLSALLSSGFPLSSVSSEVHVPGIVTGLRLQDGRQSGYMRYDFDKVRNTLIYVYQVASERNADGELEWGPNFNTTSTMNNIIGANASLMLTDGFRYHPDSGLIGNSAWLVFRMQYLSLDKRNDSLIIEDKLEKQSYDDAHFSSNEIEEKEERESSPMSWWWLLLLIPVVWKIGKRMT